MIRKLDNKDVNRIMEIWLESTIKAHRFIEKEYWQSNYNTVKDVYIPVAETYVYEENDVIKGFISIIDKEFIGALFVDNDYQGLGVGSKLINFVLNKYDTLSLAVYKENFKSVRFYKKMGFEILSEEINEDSKHPEYIMKNK